MELEYGLPKDRVKPKSNYVPWEIDQEFLSARDKVADLTIVDRMRGYELWRLVRQLENVPGDIVEVGVWKGGSGLLLAQAALSLNRPCHVFLCDTFKGIVNATDRDPRFRGGEFADCSATEVRARAASLGLTNVTVLEGVFPEETGRLVSKSLRFGHIDVDVYLSAKRSFDAIWRAISPGGVVVFDDYGFVDCAGVIKFVNEEIVGRPDALMIHNLNAHAVIVKTEGCNDSGRYWLRSLFRRVSPRQCGRGADLQDAKINL